METHKTNLLAALAALLMTTILAAPIAAGQGSGIGAVVALGAPVALA
jgi:hypothetical protein